MKFVIVKCKDCGFSTENWDGDKCPKCHSEDFGWVSERGNYIREVTVNVGGGAFRPDDPDADCIRVENRGIIQTDKTDNELEQITEDIMELHLTDGFYDADECEIEIDICDEDDFEPIRDKVAVIYSEIIYQLL